MDFDPVELMTPYQLLRDAARRILAIPRHQMGIFVDRIANDLEQIQMNLVGFCKVDLQITDEEFNDLVCDISRCYSRIVPIWPSSFIVFIYFQVRGRGKTFDEFLDYAQFVVGVNQNEDTDWVIAQSDDSPILIIYNRADKKAAKFIEENVEKLNCAETIPDDFLDHFKIPED